MALQHRIKQLELKKAMGIEAVSSTWWEDRQTEITAIYTHFANHLTVSLPDDRDLTDVEMNLLIDHAKQTIYCHAVYGTPLTLPAEVATFLLDLAAFGALPDGVSLFSGAHDCEDCGLLLPTLLDPHAIFKGKVQEVEHCPLCGGERKYSGYVQKHGVHPNGLEHALPWTFEDVVTRRQAVT
jgi:hypothetical protein